MEKLNAEGIERQCDSLSRQAQLKTLTVQRLSNEVRHLVYDTTSGQTISIGSLWIEENPALFFGAVPDPESFYFEHADMGAFARCLLVKPDFLPHVTNVNRRGELIASLVQRHSAPTVAWVRNLLELGIGAGEVRRLVRTRVEADLPELTEGRVCFAATFLSDGHRFTRSTTVQRGAWQLFEKNELLELLQLIGTMIPREVLSRMDVIREELEMPLQPLIATCVQSLRSFHDLKPDLIAIASINDLVDFLMRVRLENTLERQLMQLFQLLGSMLVRLDEDRHDTVVWRARGLTQSADHRELYAALRKSFSSEVLGRCAPLGSWLAELRTTLVEEGWAFGRAAMHATGSPEPDQQERVGCEIDGQWYFHDRHAGWQVKPGMRVMLHLPEAKKLKHLTVAKLYPLSGRTD